MGILGVDSREVVEGGRSLDTAGPSKDFDLYLE